MRMTEATDVPCFPATAEVAEGAEAEVAEGTEFTGGAEGTEQERRLIGYLSLGRSSRFTPSVSFGTLKLMSKPAWQFVSFMYVSVCAW